MLGLSFAACGTQAPGKDATPDKADNCPDECGFGIGWHVLRFGKETGLIHTGRDPGLFTFAYVSPMNRSGLVIVTNGQNAGKLVLPILEQLETSPRFMKFLQSQVR